MRNSKLIYGQVRQSRTRSKKMIIQYDYKNFKSFKNNVSFDMFASKTKVKKRFPDNYHITKNAGDILKTAVIVGENAGGKTNFIYSLQELKKMFVQNTGVAARPYLIHEDNIRKCGQSDNMLEKLDLTRQEFHLNILANDGNIYDYFLAIDIRGIAKEKLSYKTTVHGKVWNVFSVIRKDDEGEEGSIVIKIEIDHTYSNAISKYLHNSNDIGLYVTKFALLGVGHTLPFVDWVNNTLMAETSFASQDLDRSIREKGDFEETIKIMKSNEYLDLIKMIDKSISEIKVAKDDPYSESAIVRMDSNGNTYTCKISDDSRGVREFQVCAIMLYQVVKEGKVVFCDEVDSVLNPVLSDKVIAYINGSDTNGQFVFTSHNVLHLNLDKYMKEQIYFITKDVETLESEMYSLSDFDEIRYDTSKIYELYMKGLLGGTLVE